MSAENWEKPTDKMSESIGNKHVADFESEQNLIGFFSILLEEDMRINPQNYEKKKRDESL